MVPGFRGYNSRYLRGAELITGLVFGETFPLYLHKNKKYFCEDCYKTTPNSLLHVMRR